MIERQTIKSVEFAFPFALGGVDGSLPAGIYEVETIEEQIEGLSFVAYRRLSTTIVLRSAGMANRGRQITAIDPGDLAAALERDEQASRKS